MYSNEAVCSSERKACAKTRDLFVKSTPMIKHSFKWYLTMFKTVKPSMGPGCSARPRSRRCRRCFRCRRYRRCRRCHRDVQRARILPRVCPTACQEAEGGGVMGSGMGGENKRGGRPAAYPPPGVYPISHSRDETFFRGPLPSYRTLLETYTEKAQLCPPRPKYSDQTSPTLTWALKTRID